MYGFCFRVIFNSPSLEGKCSEYTPCVVYSAELSRSIFVCHGLQLWSGRDWCGAACRGALSSRGVSLSVTDCNSVGVARSAELSRSIFVCLLSRTELAENRNESNRRKLKLWSSPKTWSGRARRVKIPVWLGSGTHGSTRPSHCAVGKETWRCRGLSVAGRANIHSNACHNLTWTSSFEDKPLRQRSLFKRKRASNGEDKVYCSRKTWTERSLRNAQARKTPLLRRNGGFITTEWFRNCFVQTRFWCLSV